MNLPYWIKRSFTAFIVFNILGCNFSNEEKILAKVDVAFQESFIGVVKTKPSKSSLYMVIPRAGCSGCISSAEEFMLTCLKDSISRNKISFILTNFDSEKIIRARFGSYIAEGKNNIIIDRKDIFTRNRSLKSIYPVIFFVDGSGHLNKVSEVSPTQDGLSDAVHYLRSN